MNVTPRRATLVLLLVATVVSSSAGCLVLDLHPAYDDESIGWDPDLLGTWNDPDDKSAIEIARGEWKSYRVKYVHPIETGSLTAYLTAVDDEKYLDVMPVRGEDRGSFFVPAHAVLRVRREGDRLELTPLSYDWFADRLRDGGAIPDILAVFDQKENVLVVSPTGRLRAWLRAQPRDGPMFGAPATFVRSK